MPLGVEYNPLLEPAAGEISPWDPTRPHQDNPGAWWNQGCPPGSFAQFVALDQPLAYDYGNPNAGVRCAAVAGMTPQKLAYQSGTSAWESLNHFNAAIEQTGEDIISTAIPWGIIAVGGLILWTLAGRK